MNDLIGAMLKEIVNLQDVIKTLSTKKLSK